MNDLEIADVILGIKIFRTSDGIILSQSHYIEKFFYKFEKHDIIPMKTPMVASKHLVSNTGDSKSQLVV